MSKAHELITNYFDCLKTFDASVSAGHWLIVKKPDAVVEIACEFIL